MTLVWRSTMVQVLLNCVNRSTINDKGRIRSTESDRERVRESHEIQIKTLATIRKHFSPRIWEWQWPKKITPSSSPRTTTITMSKCWAYLSLALAFSLCPIPTKWYFLFAFRKSIRKINTLAYTHTKDRPNELLSSASATAQVHSWFWFSCQ